jgi:ATP-dependent Clp protease ATP-binding subunit ClpB
MAFRFDKLTVKSQEAVQRAQAIADDRGHPEMEPLHLHAALVADPERVARPISAKVGVNVPQLQRQVKDELDRRPQVSGGSQPSPGRQLLAVLDGAMK